MHKTILSAFLATSLLGFGCSQQDTQNAEDSLKSGAAKVEKSLEKGAAKVEKAVTTGIDTGKVKSALMASEKLDSSDINVDKEGPTFYLRGSVPSEEQKQLANRIASDMVGKDEKVVDELKVGASATPSASATP